MTSTFQHSGLAKRAALIFVFLWFFIGGLGHFLLTTTFMRIVPPSIPYAAAVVYISGLFEILGAVGITNMRSRRYAGLGLALLTVAVMPANIYMWQHPELFPSIPEWLLLLRLPIQAALILCILWCTQRF
jgi:uncharacterized membrane protein